MLGPLQVRAYLGPGNVVEADFETVANRLELRDPLRAEAEVELRRRGIWEGPAGCGGVDRPLLVVKA